MLSQIDLDLSDPPSAKRGKVLFNSPWKIEDPDLEALGNYYHINSRIQVALSARNLAAHSTRREFDAELAVMFLQPRVGQLEAVPTLTARRVTFIR